MPWYIPWGAYIGGSSELRLPWLDNSGLSCWSKGTSTALSSCLCRWWGRDETRLTPTPSGEDDEGDDSIWALVFGCCNLNGSNKENESTYHPRTKDLRRQKEQWANSKLWKEDSVLEVLISWYSVLVLPISNIYQCLSMCFQRSLDYNPSSA